MVSDTTMGTIRTANLGDRIVKEPCSVEEKAKQVAVDKYDITGAHIKVPAYFIVQYPNGDTKALHHIRDAKFISDVIRQMHLEEEESLTISGKGVPGTNPNGLLVVLSVSILALLLMTTTIVIGVF